jgi:Xaa-Pro dipeptidase
VPRDERLDRTLALMQEGGADVALLTSVGALAYAGGYAAPVETGPSPFSGGPGTLVVTREGHLTLVVPNTELPGEETRIDSVLTYAGLSREPYSASLASMYLRALGEVLPATRGLTVAVEADVIPAALAAHLRQRYRLLDVTEALIQVRSRKTAAEIEHLSGCAAVVDAGLRAARRAARPGRSELEVFADVRCTMETELGGRTAVGGDLLTGARTEAVMGLPTTRVLSEGDAVLCDLVPRRGGYWGDGCSSFAVGEPAPGFAPLVHACAEALGRAEEVLRPGITAGELDNELRAVLSAHGLEDPIHMGHGIGVAVHEYPRIVPGEPAVIEEDMVLMLEPCVAAPGVGGARLESMFRVTAGGCELLSRYELGL